MGLFEKRKPYTQQPDSLKRDIKAFFGDYKTALNLATELLFAISDRELINKQCANAHKALSASALNENHSLIFHKEFIDELPIVLRVYVGAGIQMYGELDDSIDLVKIHTTSGKLTLTGYDDFEKSVPFLVERIKIKMAEQDIDFFDYVDKKRRPPLLNKHLYLDTNNTQFEKQLSFDKRLSKLLDYEAHIEEQMAWIEFETLLNKHKKRVIGFRLSATK